MHHKNLVVLGPLSLRQGLKGVPVGGFLSAQLAELWCMWREWVNMFGDKAATLPHRWKENTPAELLEEGCTQGGARCE